MRSCSRLVVSLALAAFAMGAPVPPADVSQVAIKNPPQGQYKKFFPDPTMGIRGDATVLKFPVGA